MSELLRKLRVRCAVLVWLSLCATLLAQSGGGSLRGQILDPSGAAVPAATVTILTPDGTALVAQTNEEGRYIFRDLRSGAYTVRVRAKGFTDFEKTGVVIAAGQHQTVDVKLVVAVEKQQITIPGTTTKVSVNPANNASSVLIQGKELQALSDDPDELQSDLLALAGPSAGPNGGQIYIDSFTGGELPPKGAIREIRVNQNPFSAQYDRLGYGRIEVFTKPGIAKFHGQFLSSGNASIFNSRNPLATEVPAYHSEFFEGNIGGPLSKKASFFLDGDRRNSQDNSIVSAVVLDPNLNPTSISQAVFAPRTRTEVTPRVDYRVSENNTLAVRYQFWQNKDTNNGIGQFSLPSQAYNDSSFSHSIQVTDTQLLGEGIVNEARFRYRYYSAHQTPLSLLPTVNVIGAFQGGGNSRGMYSDTQDNYQVQNFTSVNLGNHSLRFGGRLFVWNEWMLSQLNFNGIFTFPSITAYQVTEQGLQQGWSPTQIQAAGGRASQFVLISGDPQARVKLFDAGLYVEDDWRVRPNVNLSLGLRFETQNHIHDHADFAPRFSLAWGLGGGRNPKTVLRAGFGLFYDRFLPNPILQAERLNGVTEQQYVVTSPDFFPNFPSPSTLAGSQTLTTIYQIAPNLRAPYIMQSAVGLERQVTRNATISVTYQNAHGLHQLLTRNINAPLPGTYNPAVPSSGVRPLGDVGNIYQYESAGLFNQNQLIANFRIHAGTRLSLFGYYTLNYAKSNTAGVSSFPMNQYNLAEDYGRASFDIRHRVFVGGTVGLPRGFRFSPFLAASSGIPFNITLGQDLNGDSIFSDRPGLVSPGAAGPGIVTTPFGTFDSNPLAGETIVPVNYGTGPSLFALNFRLGKTFAFGNRKDRSGSGSLKAPRGAEPSHGLGGRGLSSGGGSSTGRTPPSARYKLEFSVDVRNAFNDVNLAAPIGSLSSPLFGRSNALARGPFSSLGGAANRRVDLMVRFTF